MGARKPGLVHTYEKIEVETVTKRHKKACHRCGEVPARRRLTVVKGAGRHGKSFALCRVCGSMFLAERRAECDRAIDLLTEESMTPARMIGSSTDLK